MMETRKTKAPIQAKPVKPAQDKQMRITVDDCAVTLNFSSNKHDSVMTEVKRMILSGHVYSKL